MRHRRTTTHGAVVARLLERRWWSLTPCKPCCSWVTSLGRCSMVCSREDAAEKGGELPWQRPCHNSDGAKPGINDNPAMATSMSRHQQQSSHDKVHVGEGGKPGINDNPKNREREERQISLCPNPDLMDTYSLIRDRLETGHALNNSPNGNWTCIKTTPRKRRKIQLQLKSISK